MLRLFVELTVLTATTPPEPLGGCGETFVTDFDLIVTEPCAVSNVAASWAFTVGLLFTVAFGKLNAPPPPPPPLATADATPSPVGGFRWRSGVASEASRELVPPGRVSRRSVRGTSWSDEPGAPQGVPAGDIAL